MELHTEKDYSKVIKNPFYHIIFWLILWIVFSVRELAWHNNLVHNLFFQTLNFIFYISISYLNLYVYIPKFWNKSRYFLFTIILLATIFLVSYINSQLLSMMFGALGIAEPAEMFGGPEGFMVILTEILLIIMFTMSTNLLIQQVVKDKYARELEKKHLETELKLLKSQINPHFLFNSLNSIYVHIPRTAEVARETLVKLSELLSHQIYDVGKSKISLEKEIEHIKNYCGIEQLRNGEQVKFSIEIGEESLLQVIEVAPMLFLPFVENAFKHGKNSGKLDFFVKIQFCVENEILKFSCKNSYEPEGYIPVKGGLGLNNVKRRLELTYPKQHALEVKDENGEFEVKLNLNLNEN